MKIIKQLNIFFVLLYLSGNVFSQNTEYIAGNYYTIISYNVENLFDTINNPNTEDDELIPSSEKQWDTDKYHKKLNDLSRVINSINKYELPEIIGLIEVENRKVVEDLINNRLLLPGNYEIVHEESPDKRGIDVALIFRKNEFQYITHEKIPVHFDFEPETTTRDILYVKGRLNNNEVLHVFVNHWSSRRNGTEASEPRRIYAARLLRAKVDVIQKNDKNAKIVIMGDFNDEPSNKSLSKILKASNNKSQKNSNELYNLMYNKYLFGYGTYNYKGNWNMLDNLIVSKSLLNSDKNFEISTDGGQIYSSRWMMYENIKTGEQTPNRTYGGLNYYGGVSDHLPLYLILKK